MRKQGQLAPYVAVALLFMSSACDATPLESVTGRHATIHWDPSERHLCGGTVDYVDASLDVIAANYGVDLPAQPAIDIFWAADSNWVQSVCVSHSDACVVPLPNGTSYMVSPDVVDPHELTHTVRLNGARDFLPSFFMEGVATRWEIGWSDSSVGKDTYLGGIDPVKLRELLRAGGRIAPEEYPDAGFFWSWLEAEHGAVEMARFTAQIGLFSSVAEIERAFEQTFAMSLEQAAEASRDQPLYMFDVIACAMDDLTTLQWQSGALAITEGPSECSDDDVISSYREVVHLLRIQLPETLAEYTLVLDGSGSSAVRFDSCTGVARPYESALQYNAPRTVAPIYLSGEYIVTRIAQVQPDGTIEFPRVRLEQP